MARTKKVNLSKQGEFKHGTSIGENGEILYDFPIEIHDEADLRNYHITDEDCRYLHPRLGISGSVYSGIRLRKDGTRTEGK